MSHEEFKELLQLSVHGELSEEQERKLEDHLAECPGCSRELTALRQFTSLINQHTPPAPGKRLLDEARQQLRGALSQESSRQSIFGRLKDSLVGLASPGVRLAYSSGLALVAGIGLGALLFGTAPDEGPSRAIFQEQGQMPSDTRITNVRFLSSDLNTGEVEFFFEAMKAVRMKGNINDTRIQKILTHALLTEQNPGVRLQTINTIAAQKTPDKEIKSALISAVQSDENAGVRQEALKALQRFGMDHEIKNACLHVLTHDENPGLRIAAINFLDSARSSVGQVDQQVLNVLREKMNTDDNNYIRLRARAVVEEINQ